MAEETGGSLGRDLVVVALPSVQRFIAEARSTSDVAAASAIYSALAGKIIRVLADEARAAGGEIVLPAASGDQTEDDHARAASGDNAESGVPNRVVALLPEGKEAARKACREMGELWRDFVQQTFGKPVDTRGFPVAHWVCVPSHPGGYEVQWEEAQQLLQARKRVRDFGWVEWRESALCSLAPRWTASDPPAGLKDHEKATLSAVGWVKRRWHRTSDRVGFPSTSSIASAPFRRAVLEHLGDPDIETAVGDLARHARQVIRATQGGDIRETRIAGLPRQDAGPTDWFASTGGPWVYADRWQAESLARESKTDPASIKGAVEAGRKAAGRLRDLMKERYHEPEPAAYLAVLVQDVDSMGGFLAGTAASASGTKIDVTVASHQHVSGVLRQAARRQRDLLEMPDILGVPVYSGGDDLLAFTPSRTALQAAMDLQEAQEALSPELPFASTAVLFFHNSHAGLQGVLARARSLLDEAKDKLKPRKHALAVGYVRRSGVAEVSIQPWPAREGRTSADLFGVFSADMPNRLSPRLLADLERDEGELGKLSRQYPDLFRAELARLVTRHTAKSKDTRDDAVRAAAARAADALDWLGSHEQAGPDRPDEVSRLENAARVGVFLRQEAR